MKYCPIMAFNADNDCSTKVYDYTPSQIERMKTHGAVMISSDQPFHMERVGCECKESDCAWRSEERKCCGVVK